MKPMTDRSMKPMTDRPMKLIRDTHNCASGSKSNIQAHEFVHNQVTNMLGSNETSKAAATVGKQNNTNHTEPGYQDEVAKNRRIFSHIYCVATRATYERWLKIEQGNREVAKN